jgi:hypothetical protein
MQSRSSSLVQTSRCRSVLKGAIRMAHQCFPLFSLPAETAVSTIGCRDTLCNGRVLASGWIGTQHNFHCRPWTRQAVTAVALCQTSITLSHGKSVYTAATTPQIELRAGQNPLLLPCLQHDESTALADPFLIIPAHCLTRTHS